MHRVAVATFWATLAVETVSFVLATSLAIQAATVIWFSGLPVLTVSALLAWGRQDLEDRAKANRLDMMLRLGQSGAPAEPQRNGHHSRYGLTWPEAARRR